MKNLILESLVQKKLITSYALNKLDEEGKPGKSVFRNTEQIVLVFNDGTKVKFDTFCSGSAEDTTLHITEGE